MTSGTDRISSRDVRTRPGEPERVPGESVGKTEGGPARVAGKVALFLLVLVFLNYGMGWIAQQIAFQLWPRHVHMALTVLTASVVAYVLLLAIPFLPGVEIGLVAGMSRLFSYPKYLLAVCLAISPVPILFLLRGT